MGFRKYLKENDTRIDRPDIGDREKCVFILHDQLNLKAWPDWVREEKPLLVFIESFEKGNSLPYHKKKLMYVLSSMRHFALDCYEQDFPVLYLSDKRHYDLVLQELLKENRGLQLNFMTPSEWDSRQRLHAVKDQYPERVDEVNNRFFFADPEDWKQKIEPGYRMEYFYRAMRKETGYLMN